MITEENKELILINRYIQAEIMDKMCKTSDSKEIYILANFLHQIEIYEYLMNGKYITFEEGRKNLRSVREMYSDYKKETNQ